MSGEVAGEATEASIGQQAQGVPYTSATATVAAPTPAPALASAPASKIINVKILSPAFEASSSGLHIRAIAADTMVGALKQKICDTAATEHADTPCPPERQRLIYHGHVLANDMDTLTSVFGPAQIHQETDFTIHLVLRPVSTALAAAAMPLQPSGRPSPLPSAPLTRSTPTPTPTHHHPLAGQAPRPQHAAAAAPLPIPPQVRLGPGLPPPAGLMPQLPGFAMPPLPGMHAFGQHMPQNMAQIQQQHQQQQQHFQHHYQQHFAQAQQQHPVLANGPGGPAAPATQTTTVTGPNGTRYTVRVNTSTFAVPHPAQQHAPAHQRPFPPPNPLANLPPQFLPALHPFLNHPAMHGAANAPLPSAPDVNISEAFDDPVTANDVRELAELTSQFATLMQAEPTISDLAREAAQTLRTNTDAIAARLRDITARTAAADLRPSGPPDVANSQINSPQSADGTTLQNPVQQFEATAATVYLLSSPAGPHAVLFAPQGTYAGHPAQPFGQAFTPQHPAIFGQTNVFSQPHAALAPTPAPVADANPAPQEPQNPAPGQHHPPGLQQPLPGEQEVRQLVRQFNIERQNQPADLLAPWQPLLAQFWLLFRVMLFAYFFMPVHLGWYRPAAMAALCLVMYLLTGHGLGRGVRDAVMRWWEGVVDVPARPAQPPQQAGQERGQPLPALAANIAPRHDQDQQLHWLRQTLRPLERALALFLASLWPGIGERTVAARRAEEDRQRREAQEETQRRQDTEAQASAAAAEVAETEQADANAAARTDVPERDALVTAVDPTPSTGVSTSTDVGATDELRERKPTPRAATVADEPEPVSAGQVATD